LAVTRLRDSLRSDAQIGVTLNVIPAYANDERPETLTTVEAATRANRWFADPLFKGAYPACLFETIGATPFAIAQDDFSVIHTPIDFLGVNYYSRVLYQTDDDGKTRPVQPEPGKSTDMHWEVYPQGLHDVLMWLENEYHPSSLVVMENGSA